MNGAPSAAFYGDSVFFWEQRLDLAALFLTLPPPLRYIDA